METQNKGIPFIGAEVAKQIDNELMSTFGYSIDQLMELAGLSVSTVISDRFISTNPSIKKILTICGPGNNGGDGLVASRYLKEFHSDISIDILYPKRSQKDLYQRLVKQCENYAINFKDISVLDQLESYDLIIDAIFGFSFSGDLRSPFDTIVPKLNIYSDKIVSIDIPSGWDVEKGNIKNTFYPKCLISLTLPKKCSITFTNNHYLGGRFVPKALYAKFNLEIKDNIYNGSSLYVLI